MTIGKINNYNNYQNDDYFANDNKNKIVTRQTNGEHMISLWSDLTRGEKKFNKKHGTNLNENDANRFKSFVFNTRKDLESINSIILDEDKLVQVDKKLRSIAKDWKNVVDEFLNSDKLISSKKEMELGDGEISETIKKGRNVIVSDGESDCLSVSSFFSCDSIQEEGSNDKVNEKGVDAEEKMVINTEEDDFFKVNEKIVDAEEKMIIDTEEDDFFKELLDSPIKKEDSNKGEEIVDKSIRLSKKISIDDSYFETTEDRQETGWKKEFKINESYIEGLDKSSKSFNLKIESMKNSITKEIEKKTEKEEAHKALKPSLEKIRNLESQLKKIEKPLVPKLFNYFPTESSLEYYKISEEIETEKQLLSSRYQISMDENWEIRVQQKITQLEKEINECSEQIIKLKNSFTEIAFDEALSKKN